MAASISDWDRRIKPAGRSPGKARGPIVKPDDYPKLLAMHQEGYLNSAIGRAFGISGTHAGKLIRKYQAEAGL
jgi:hypothetical protein